MITKFATVYAGHVDLPDMGQTATPANERRYSNERLATVFAKTVAVARPWESWATTRSGSPSTTSSAKDTSAFSADWPVRSHLVNLFGVENGPFRHFLGGELRARFGEVESLGRPRPEVDGTC